MQTLRLRRFSLWFLIALAMAASARAAQTYTWAGGASTAWLTATNWSPNGVPGVDDTAIINSGSPQLPGAGVALPIIQFNNGVLGGTGTVTSSMTWTTGRLDAVLSIASGGTLTINGTDTSHDLANGGTINNQGTTIWSGGYLWRMSSDASTAACSFNNLAGGIFEMTGNNQAYVLNSKAWTFTNAGTVRKTGGTGLSRIEPTAYNNTGVTEIQVGTLQLGGPSSASPGSFVVAGGTAMWWMSGGITDGAVLSGLGEQQIKGGTLNGAIACSNLAITGTVGGNATLTGSAQLRAGIISGSMQISGAMDWQSGRVDGTLSINAGSSLSISGTDATHELANGGTVNNAGTATWSAGYIWRLSGDASATTCSINNLAGGIFEITGNNNAYVLNNRAWSFNNAGTLRKKVGTGVSQIVPTAFNNTGSVEVQTGTLQLGGPSSASAGSFSASNGAVMIWASGGITDGASFSGVGENRINGGTINGAINCTNLVITGSVTGTSVLTGSAQLRGGILAGTMEMAGTMDWQLGRVDGTLNIASGGALLISGTDNIHELANGGTVNNAGTATWSAGYIWRLSGDASATTCSINNLAGGVFEITGNNNAYVNSKPWNFTNAGVVRKKAGIGISQILPTAFNNSGVVEVQTGTLKLGGPSSVSSGAFNTAYGTVMIWINGGITDGASFSGVGENQINGGTINGSISSTNMIITGTVAGVSTISGAAVLRNGVMAGSMDMTGSLDWQGGRVDGTLNIAAGGALGISGTDQIHELANGGTVNNAGTATWSAGYIWRMSGDASATTCSINNLAGGVFEITGNNNAYLLNARPWSFNNAGTLRKKAGIGISQILPTAFNNTGVVEVQVGTLQLGGLGSFSPGVFNASAGAYMKWISGGITDGASFTGAGENQVNGGTINGAITSTNLVITGSVGGTSNVSGTAMLRAGTLAGIVEVTGTLDWQNGRVDGTLSILNGGTLLISGADMTHELANGGTVNNAGTTTWSAGYIWRLSGDASATTCAFNNLAGGVFEITGNNSAYLLNNRPWSFNNAGTVRKLSTGRTSINITAFTNMATTGLVEVVAGVLQLGNFNQTAGTVWLESGNIECTNLQIQGGALKGTQSLVGNVTQTGGQIQPGSGIGTLTITGNLIQSGTGVLFAEIGGKTAGTQCDQLIVNGTATLGGGVSGTFVNGFLPRLGDEFSVLRCASRPGAYNWTPFVAQVGRKMIPSSAATETRLVTGLETMNFTNWAEATGLTGLDAQLGADPDHDGMSNRLEYGLYLFPWVSDNKNGPAPAVTGTPQRIQITYNRINDANDLDIEVESSTDMTTWQTIARSHHGAATADVSGGSFSITETPFPNYTKVIVVDQSAISPTQARRYLRVRVTDS